VWTTLLFTPPYALHAFVTLAYLSLSRQGGGLQAKASQELRRHPPMISYVQSIALLLDQLRDAALCVFFL
jgi:hypothetical protein